MAEWSEGMAEPAELVWCGAVRHPDLFILPTSHCPAFSGHRVIGYYKYPQQIILISGLPTSAGHRYLAHKLIFK